MQPLTQGLDQLRLALLQHTQIGCPHPVGFVDIELPVQDVRCHGEPMTAVGGYLVAPGLSGLQAEFAHQPAHLIAPYLTPFGLEMLDQPAGTIRQSREFCWPLAACSASWRCSLTQRVTLERLMPRRRATSLQPYPCSVTREETLFTASWMNSLI